ncbi:MAG TPA: hypothetical protein VM223_19370, partial [Planctomycetota bacterium]|nr:hypothetical protein [Planctomycetota bacterium]
MTTKLTLNGIDQPPSDLTLNGQPSSTPTRVYRLPNTLDKPTSDALAQPWAVGTAYVTSNLVAVGNVVYYALQNGTGKPPATEPTYWAVLSGADGDYQDGTPIDGESRRQINTDGTITDHVLGIDYPQNPATMDVVNGTGVATPAGAWAGATTYAEGKMVSDGGVAYIASQNVPINIQPGVTEGWAAYWGATGWATDAASPPTHAGRTWPGAAAACEALSWNGSADWRLPNIFTLMQLFTNWEASSNYVGNPVTKPRLFPGIPASSYWWSSNRGPSNPMSHAEAFDARYVQVLRTAMTTATYFAYPIRPAKNARVNRVLNNPYAGIDWGTVTHAKAALHVHTTESSKSVAPGHAVAMPHEQVDAYRAAGYTILSITDHNIVAAWPWTGWHAYDASYEDRDPATAGMVAIRGNERTDSAGWHQVMMFSGYNTVETSVNVVLAVLADGGFSRIAHPTWGQNLGWYGLQTLLYPYDAAYDAGLHGIEIINSGTLGLDIGDQKDPFVEEGRTGADIALWDLVLSYTMPYRPVWGYCVDDSHVVGPHAGEMAEAAYTVILVDELTDAKVRAAMVAGALYGVSGGTPPTLTAVLLDETAQTVTIQASDWTEIDWISEGVIIASGETLEYGRLNTVKSY